ncbi:UDP-N-acetylmuramoyl-L-alanyl-D-glutamate--2,6-diaminopimelate ligase [Clostridium sp. 19966]|uniref:UDP-N-acetylmuramoyl-L-alanyl-D-glutamate--2, 6-diaminopimelate ligase n=1 Tax=Clostridium sp. 19966 TaxID=2768166 RepID=UPI0028DFEC1E|nr:UDP-N-acetylmuramoyl-L-alanyl-D-glutamate--2,6-diaminopimelate ligase [Clostridium sp. 19966]MDT8716623.1 UDP-N-acetylmuramoyl-L-alanyl-D-glutamate--2,6-diaminopimelate ligase [Clostridium sp. 19966]
MKLSELLNGIDYKVISGNVGLDINNIQYNSRLVGKNDAFFCITGYNTDGHIYAKSAVENGAAVIICEKKVDVGSHVLLVQVADCRKALAVAGANYYENPAKKMKIIGITGTNGKTTTTYMIKSVLEKAGYKTGLIGTIANYIGDKKIHSERTTPESLELQKLFYEMVQQNVKYCIMEVSSHSLELNRVYGVKFDYGIFTNLTQDHLDFHKTFENYYNAKLKLFKNSKMSIINIDNEYGKRVYEDTENDKITYGIENATVTAKNIKMYSRGADFTINYDGVKKDVTIFIPGMYNVYNSLAAIAVALKENISLENIEKGLKDTQVPGRCELVTKDYDLGYDIIIDYAHTPDGLENILKTAREFTKGRLISLFGCGGNRDKSKRPIMGKIGSELSDISIITSDNPRDEEPMEIIKDILQGVNGEHLTIENRREAIEKAISIAGKGDVIVIAGKGHEDYQIFKNNQIIHFDEREIVKEILEKVNNQGC